MASLACTHCGADVPPALVDPNSDTNFCCAGCRRVYGVLHGCGLDGFYGLREATGGGHEVTPPPAPFDAGGLAAYRSADFIAQHVEEVDARRQRITWWVAGVHCAACVWLLEHLGSVTTGIHAARLDFGRQRLVVDFEPTQTDPTAIAKAIASLGYQPHPWRDGDDERRRREERRWWYTRTAVAAACSMASMHLTWSVYAGEASGDMGSHERQLFGVLALAVSIPGVWWAGWPFVRGALGALRARRMSVDVTTSLVLLAGWVISVIHLAMGSAEIYFDAIAMFVAFLLGGRLVFLAARDRVAASGDALDHVLPRSARRAAGSHDHDGQLVAVTELAVGDRILVRSGDRIPADGLVLDQDMAVDASVLTGEARPVQLAPGETVHAGCHAVSTGALAVTAHGADTRLGQVINSVRAQTNDPGNGHLLADQLQAWFAPLVAALALLTFLVWWPHDTGFAWAQAVAVILVACPCALGLAAPLGYARALGGAAHDQTLIRDAAALETLGKCPRHIVFDKTGTLTTGTMQVIDWTWLIEDATRQAGVAQLIAAAEERSAHPLAAAIARAARQQAMGTETSTQALTAITRVPGSGLSADSPYGRLLIGRPGFAGPEGDEAEATVVQISLDGVLLARLTIGEQLRPEAHTLITTLTSKGHQCHIASGDAPAAVASIAAAIGIPADAAHARLGPEAKAELVMRLRTSGAVVVIGDGINDTAALAAADVAIGVRGGLESAVDACDIFLIEPDLRRLERVLTAGRTTSRLINLNLGLSAGYNLVGIGLAMAGWWGPYLCAVAMPLSSLSVVLLSQWWRAWPRWSAGASMPISAQIDPDST